MTYLASFLTAAHLLLVVMISVRVLLRENISSSARLAWIIVVLTLPIVGLVAYLLLGEVYLPKDIRNRHQVAFSALRAAHPAVFGGHESLRQLPAHIQQPFRLGQSINGFAAVPGNTAELMADSETSHERLIADIDAATDSVNLLYYIWLTDRTGTEIGEALIRAVARGVTCRAAADNLGSRRLLKSDLWRKMEKGGVQLQVAMPLNSVFGISLITRADLRNHRKLTVIDGKIAYIGSKNAADPGFAPKAKFGPWIDIMLRVQGPVVNQVQALFASDWMLQSDSTPGDFQFAALPDPKGFPAQFRGTGPLERQQSAAQIFCTLFEMARSELIVTTPYFVPDLTVLAALQAAALRGVTVILILPKRNDSWVVKAASRGVYRALLEAGVEIREHGPGLLHSKIVTVDGEVTLLGSTNLDLRSFDLNFENDLLFHDKPLTTQIRARQQTYLDQSERVTRAEIRARPMLARLRDNVIATLGPIL